MVDISLHAKNDEDDEFLIGDNDGEYADDDDYARTGRVM
jgi:hypothetical protein